MASLPDSALQLILYLACGYIFVYAGIGIFYRLSDWSDRGQEDRLAPVKLSAWQPILRSFNPAHWGGRYRCETGRACVREACPVMRRGRGRLLGRFPVKGGAFGFVSFFPDQIHYDVIWYKYEVNGITFYGKSRFPFGFETTTEAASIAANMVGKIIPIRYDPSAPEDSKPIFREIMQMLSL